MSNLSLLLIRLAFLAVLWLFVIAAVGVVRTDLFGSSRAGRQRRPQRKPPPAKAPRPPRPGRAGRGAPQPPPVTGGRLAAPPIGLGDQQITHRRAKDSPLGLVT